ncbi:MAG TPA: DUF1028 domain-containing protein [Ohtaekwangia sp.]|uniref:DUF1028 domain-containing protein n=1 Tax=Ohtaekwangia sp. TaxID=2066019 RepID=UPI002F93B692
MRPDRFIVLLLLAMLMSVKANATWSIIIIDTKTNTIGIAGASCSPNCYGIGKIIPGIGAIIVQAMSNNAARSRGVEMILANATPEEIIRALRDPAFDPERQQYAVITVKYKIPATYTGDLTHTARGALTAPGISVQGNTLTDDQVLEKVMQTVVAGQKESLAIDVILMKALEAGSDAGGDNRCGEQRATSAFITIFRKDDSPRRPFLDLNTFGQPKGGQNAVVLLRKRYDRWKERQAD